MVCLRAALALAALTSLANGAWAGLRASQGGREPGSMSPELVPSGSLGASEAAAPEHGFQDPYEHDRSHPNGAHVGPHYIEFPSSNELVDGTENGFRPAYVHRGYFHERASYERALREARAAAVHKANEMVSREQVCLLCESAVTMGRVMVEEERGLEHAENLVSVTEMVCPLIKEKFGEVVPFLDCPELSGRVRHYYSPRFEGEVPLPGGKAGRKVNFALVHLLESCRTYMRIPFCKNNTQADDAKWKQWVKYMAADPYQRALTEAEAEFGAKLQALHKEAAGATSESPKDGVTPEMSKVLGQPPKEERTGIQEELANPSPPAEDASETQQVVEAEEVEAAAEAAAAVESEATGGAGATGGAQTTAIVTQGVEENTEATHVVVKNRIHVIQPAEGALQPEVAAEQAATTATGASDQQFDEVAPEELAAEEQEQEQEQAPAAATAAAAEAEAEAELETDDAATAATAAAAEEALEEEALEEELAESAAPAAATAAAEEAVEEEIPVEQAAATGMEADDALEQELAEQAVAATAGEGEIAAEEEMMMAATAGEGEVAAEEEFAAEPEAMAATAGEEEGVMEQQETAPVEPEAATAGEEEVEPTETGDVATDTSGDATEDQLEQELAQEEEETEKQLEQVNQEEQMEEQEIQEQQQEPAATPEAESADSATGSASADEAAADPAAAQEVPAAEGMMQFKARRAGFDDVNDLMARR